MEEELNEHDLEERLYAMLHHVDQTQNNLNQTSNQIDTTQLIENRPRGTVRRYWRTSDSNPYVKINTSNPHVKVNTPNPHVKVNTTDQQAKTNKPKSVSTVNVNTISKPDAELKAEKDRSPTPPAIDTTVDLSIFQSPIPQNVSKVIQIIEHDDHVNHQVVLESSDEDEVVEVALPPKPTIMIESSDEEELSIVKPDSASKTPVKQTNKSKNGDRAISASPVPSVVSSVSDDFIRGDCIALNITSRQPDNPSFDFSLHGPDLGLQNTPTKKKKKRKNREAVTSTPIAEKITTNGSEECFATPKSKAKNKKKAKTNTVAPKTVSTPDVYDSDSNQSIIDITKGKSSYVTTEKSLPNTDVYESDSNQSENQTQLKGRKRKNSYIVTEKSLPSADVYESDSNPSEFQIIPKANDTTQDMISSDSSSSIDKHQEPSKSNDSELFQTCESIVDLTGNDSFYTIDKTGITESIVMANVTGFTESQDYGDENHTPSEINANISKYVSSKVPSILNADLDFDNLKGNERVCKKRWYSFTTLRAEMEKFYNESWGGEDFNHREIQKNMSRDKNLWAIDPKDKMPTGQRKQRCNHCNRVGHRDDACMRKPAVCYMCGNSGHYESRCPRKICINCGSPNHMFTNICRNCSSWGRIVCSECNQNGHPASHCPDLWRRYHNTIDITMPLERCFQTKQWAQLYCSGCSRRGHLIHTCRTTVPFASHAINTPYVCVYRPILFPRYEHAQNKQTNRTIPQDSTISSATTPKRPEPYKRHSKSPVSHETHQSKKRNLSAGDETKSRQVKNPVPSIPQQTSTPKVDASDKNESTKSNVDKSNESVSEKAPDFIPIGSSNHNNKGQVIQDNEISDSSEVITSSRIYVTSDVFENIQSKDGQIWLKETTANLDVILQCCGGAYPFLNITGKVGDQESFQYLLREKKWSQDSEDTPTKSKNETNDPPPQQAAVDPSPLKNLPKNRYELMRQLTKALDSLKQNLGDPNSIYKELTFLQIRHEKLARQRVINPTVLLHSRTNINSMLKKLNIVLLGQAGLADGSDSVNQLYSYREKLSTLRANTISVGMRKEIGQHFHNIFSPTARNDYTELLQKYDLSNPKKSTKHKTQRKPRMSKNKINKLSSIPPQHDNHQFTGPGPQNKTHYVHITKLKLFHKRLMNCKPKEAVLKKNKMDLVRKIHTCITSMLQKEKLSSKALKKVKRAQAEAQNFLSTYII